MVSIDGMLYIKLKIQRALSNEYFKKRIEFAFAPSCKKKRSRLCRNRTGFRKIVLECVPYIGVPFIGVSYIGVPCVGLGKQWND
jgi:hypothetical protein